VRVRMVGAFREYAYQTVGDKLPRGILLAGRLSLIEWFTSCLNERPVPFGYPKPS